MAYTDFSTSANLTQKLWAKRGYIDSISDATLVGQMIKDGSLKFMENASREAGDRIRYRLLARGNSVGFAGNESAVGLEDALTYYDDDVEIDLLRFVQKMPASHTMTQQRVNFDIEEDVYTILKNQMIERQTVSVLYNLCGFYPTTITFGTQTFTGDNRLKITGFNVPTAPSTGRIIRINDGANDSITNADSTATLNLAVITRLEGIAEKANPYIQPLVGAPMGIKYRFYVHTDGFNQIINDVTAPYQHRDIVNSQIAGGSKKEATFGRSFVFGNTEVISSDKLPNGVHSNSVQSNVRRALFVGANAGAFAYGQGYGSGKDAVAGVVFKQGDEDTKHFITTSVNAIFGVTKSVFNSVDHAAVVVSHYVAS